jgi:hypothetical protein
MNKVEKRLRQWKEKTHWTKSNSATFHNITDIQEFVADHIYSIVAHRLHYIPMEDWHLYRNAIIEAAQDGIATAMDEYQGTL